MADRSPTDLSLESVPDSQGGSPPRRRDTAARERPHHNATRAPAQAAGTERELEDATGMVSGENPEQARRADMKHPSRPQGCTRCGGTGRRIRERNPQGWPIAWSECRHD